MRKRIRVWFVACIILLGSTVPIVAQTPGTGVRVEEFTYTGDGGVASSDGELSLWLSGVHEFTVTVAADREVRDGEVCLVSVPEGGGTVRTLACRPASVPANGTRTIAVAVEQWPRNRTGGQTVQVLLKTPNATGTVAVDSLSVTVVRKGGDIDGDGQTNEREASLGTSVREADTDSDGLSDKVEAETYGTSPKNRDTDGDGLTDRMEIDVHQTNPVKTDSDGDGLRDSEELQQGTNPNQGDSDGDGVNDAREVNTYATNPLVADTDGDGLDDGAETNEYRTNPSRSDTDGDELNDNLEVNTYDADPNRIDTDGDGLGDGSEVYDHGTDPAREDSDNDGITDGQEVNTYGTSPTNSDSDSDGLPDGSEVKRYATNPKAADTDGDGRSDGVEVDRQVLVRLPLPAAGSIGILVLVLVGSGILYRSNRVSIAAVRRLPRAIGMNAGRKAEPKRTEATESSESDDGASPDEEIAPELLSNEARIAAVLDEHEGRIRQSDIIDETGWSKSKVSRVLSKMEEDEQIVKIDIGRANVITRPYDVPSWARSPFDRSDGGTSSDD